MLDEYRLLHLISAHFDQQLAADERRELESMLLSSAKARAILAERAEWHGLLREWALREQTSDLMLVPDEPAVAPLPRRRRWAVPAIAALAACVTVVLLVREYRPDPTPLISSTDTADGGVALLAQALDAEWETDSPAFAVGSALPKGLIKLRRGTLRLDFYSGARVFLEGPATLDLVSPDLARLELGKLTAHVPPPAQGFTITSADLRVVDRGTEFGMSVNGANDCEVHVFVGEVDLLGDNHQQQALLAGSAVSIRKGVWEPISVNRSSFADPALFSQATVRETEARWNTWSAWSRDFRKTSDLLVYFDFENIEPFGQVIQNRALGAPDSTHGSIIGCESGQGRWAGKSALGFAKTSDRILFLTEGKTISLTLMASVRVDSLPLDHNHLLSMAPFQVGEIHWKLDQAGRLLLGIRASSELRFDAWERLESPCIVTTEDFGRWMHLVTVIDGENGLMKHYVNGEEVASASMKLRPQIQLGSANLGNFDAAQPSIDDGVVVRNFNGRIDEFALIGRALSASEIRNLKQ